MKTTLTVTPGQAQFPAICRSGQTAAITRNGEVVAFVVPRKRMADLLEQMEILSNPAAMAAINKAKVGKTKDYPISVLIGNWFLTLRDSGRIAFTSCPFAVTLCLPERATSVSCFIFRRVWEACLREHFVGADDKGLQQRAVGHHLRRALILPVAQREMMGRTPAPRRLVIKTRALFHLGGKADCQLSD